MTPQIENPRERIRSLAAIISMTAVVGMTLGLTLPLLAIILENRGESATMIGFNTAMQALGLLVVTPWVPRLLRLMGTFRFLAVNLALAAGSLVAMKSFDSLGAWFALRFLLGAAEGSLFTVSEAWINVIAPAHRRGRVMGAYTAILAGAFAIGATMIRVTGIEGWLPFAAGAGLTVIAGLPLLMVRSSPPAMVGQTSHGLTGYMRLAPVAAAAALAYGALETGVFALLAPYGLRNGLDAADAAQLIAVLAAGNVALQLPIGIMADRMDRHLLLMICAGAGVFGGATLPLLINMPLLLWPSLFIWGGVIVGMYTVGLTILGERFHGPDLVGANAAFVMLYGIGALVGPPVGGGAMDFWDPHGLALALAAICLIFIIAAAWWRRSQPAASTSP